MFLVALVTSFVCLLCPTWCTEVGRVKVQFAILKNNIKESTRGTRHIRSTDTSGSIGIRNGWGGAVSKPPQPKTAVTNKQWYLSMSHTKKTRMKQPTAMPQQHAQPPATSMAAVSSTANQNRTIKAPHDTESES